MNQSDSFLSNKNFTVIKGWLALGVLIHHLYQFSGIFSNITLGGLFLFLGRWCVDGFLFMSGYGLLASYQNKGQSYISTFLKKRLIPFYFTYLLYVLIYIIFTFLRGGDITAIKIIKSLTFGETIVSFGWYFQVSYALYLIFFLCYKLGKTNKQHFILLNAVTVLFACICLLISYPYYYTIVAFLMGAYVAFFEEKLETLLKSGIKWAALVLGGTVWFVCSACRYRPHIGIYFFSNFQLEIIGVVMDISFIVVFVSLLCIFERLIQKCGNFRVSKYLSNNSLAIYVMQGLVLMTVFHKFSNVYLATVLSAVLVLLLSPFLRIITEKYQSCLTYFLNK